MAIANINPWPIRYIIKLREQATYEAERARLRPTTAREAMHNWKTRHRFSLPFLGDYVPEGWERVPDDEIQPWFVSRSPIGKPVSENIISQADLYRIIKRGSTKLAYGVIEQGQIMVVVAAYRRVKDDRKAKTKPNPIRLPKLI